MTDRAGEERREPTKLQRKVAAQIAEYIRDNGLEGGRLTELGIADALKVSRTPVRGALDHLADMGIVNSLGPRRGYEVCIASAALTELTQERSNPDEEEALYMRIAMDYVARRLPDQLFEADLMRQYGVHRGLLLRTLQRMARENVIERNLGHGWRFPPLLRSLDSHDKSYRYRIVVEPAAILEPTFVLDSAWAERTRRDHDAILQIPPEKLSMIRFFDMNAEFHEGLAACSGNQFFHQTVQLQNQLRRFLTYSEDLAGRVEGSCQEHMQVLEALEGGDREWAARLMQRHLEIASRDKPLAVQSGEAIPG